MAIVTYNCTGCKPIDRSIIDVYIQLMDTEAVTSANEASRVTAEEGRVSAETARETTFANDHNQATTDHSTFVSDHNRASADHSTAATDHENAVADRNGYTLDHATAVSDHDKAVTDHANYGVDHVNAGNDHARAESDHSRAASDHTRAGEDHSAYSLDHAQAVADHERAESDHAGLSDVLRYSEQSLTDQQKEQARRNIGAGTYSKPAGGIPASDMASDVIPDVSGFVTKSVNDLLYYYLKSETYTKAEVDQLISAIGQLSYVVADSLPTASADTMYKIYLVPSSDPKVANVKDEYITIVVTSGASSEYRWEKIGSTAIDLANYVTIYDLQAALADYVTNTYLNERLYEYVTTVQMNTALEAKVSTTDLVEFTDQELETMWNEAQ